jgi:hypothetical protein
MTTSTFWELETLVNPTNDLQNSNDLHHQSSRIPNGEITFSTRLSISLQYFAGGSPYDISFVHGVSHSVVFQSIWFIVDKINNCKSLKIEFPKDHTAQLEFKIKVQLTTKIALVLLMVF